SLLISGEGKQFFRHSRILLTRSKIIPFTFNKLIRIIKEGEQLIPSLLISGEGKQFFRHSRILLTRSKIIPFTFNKL
ncbi:hypothetical protein EDM34_14915, partial [Staphylococcus aureus]